MRLYPTWELCHNGTYDTVVEGLLAARNLSRNDLTVDFTRLHKPTLLTDLDRGAQRLAEAIQGRERVVVYGDYDTDGVTSTAVMLDFFQKVAASCGHILPDRHKDGYGIKPLGVRRALDQGAAVIVTVDNGIAAHEALVLARNEGVDVVVIDHHKQMGELPPAHSVINPNRRDCDYPFKGLAGVGVAFKVVQALSEAFLPTTVRRRYLNSLLDLVALGTVADVMPVLDENRLFIQRGLEIMESNPRPGLQQLRSVAGYSDRRLNTAALGYQLVPRLNVAGRIESPETALGLLTSQSSTEAAQMASHLNGLNQRRQRLQREALAEAETLIGPEDVQEDHIIVVLGAGWHVGVVGLLAGRLSEKFSCPAVACTDARGDGIYTGSGRSIPGYDISEGISSAAGHLISHGGHAAAAGFSLAADRFEAFRCDLVAHARRHLQPADLQARLTIDMVLAPEDIRLSTLRSLEELEPFGAGHQAPVFAALDCCVVSTDLVGRDASHLKLSLDIGGRQCNAIWWGRAAAVEQIQVGHRVDVVFGLEEDTYARNGTVQMTVIDMCAGRVMFV